MGNIEGWKMIDAVTGDDVEPDKHRADFRDEPHMLIGVSSYPEGNSTGRVSYRKGATGPVRDCYPSVFGVKIVPDVVVPDTPEGVVRDPRITSLTDEIAEQLSRLGVADAENVQVKVTTETTTMASGRLIHDAMAKAIGRIGEELFASLADILAEFAAAAYFAGVADGKAGRSGLDMSGGCPCGRDHGQDEGPHEGPDEG